MTPTRPNELWVCDITYWETKNDLLHVSLITDPYSHKILGYAVSETLAAIHAIEALKQALSTLKEPIKPLIHHSDRGVQYCSDAYVKRLQSYGIEISMTAPSNPLKNPIAERAHGIIKQEYLAHCPVYSLKEGKSRLKRSIVLYNEERPHMSLGNNTPEQVHQSPRATEKLWKNYHRK